MATKNMVVLLILFVLALAACTNAKEVAHARPITNGNRALCMFNQNCIDFCKLQFPDPPTISGKCLLGAVCTCYDSYYRW